MRIIRDRLSAGSDQSSAQVVSADWSYGQPPGNLRQRLPPRRFKSFLRVDKALGPGKDKSVKGQNAARKRAREGIDVRIESQNWDP